MAETALSQCSYADLAQQVQRQYEAVAFLAKCMMEVHEQIAPLIGSGSYPRRMVEDFGGRSAHIMEFLGDMLNNMDAMDDGDEEITEAAFEGANKLFLQVEK